MELELTGKRTLVTGASRGIGRAIAEELRAEGCHVVVNARNHAALSEVAASLGAVAVSGDVTRPEQASRVVADVVAELGGLDVLVCNVGGGASVRPGEETASEWQRVFALNFWSATNCIEAAIGALKASCGSIVCISSICGLEVVPGAPVTYSAAKAALNSYVRGIARPLGEHGVRINAVAPGNIVFDGSVWSSRLTEDAAGIGEMLKREVALARLGAPREIASLVAYLASVRSAFATGGIWTLDGGQRRA